MEIIKSLELVRSEFEKCTHEAFGQLDVETIMLLTSFAPLFMDVVIEDIEGGEVADLPSDFMEYPGVYEILNEMGMDIDSNDEFLYSFNIVFDSLYR